MLQGSAKATLFFYFGLSIKRANRQVFQQITEDRFKKIIIVVLLLDFCQTSGPHFPFNYLSLEGALERCFYTAQYLISSTLHRFGTLHSFTSKKKNRGDCDYKYDTVQPGTKEQQQKKLILAFVFIFGVPLFFSRRLKAIKTKQTNKKTAMQQRGDRRVKYCNIQASSTHQVTNSH